MKVKLVESKLTYKDSAMVNLNLERILEYKQQMMDQYKLLEQIFELFNALLVKW
jgi:hypothetical protein